VRLWTPSCGSRCSRPCGDELSADVFGQGGELVLLGELQGVSQMVARRRALAGMTQGGAEGQRWHGPVPAEREPAPGSPRPRRAARCGGQVPVRLTRTGRDGVLHGGGVQRSYQRQQAAAGVPAGRHRRPPTGLVDDPREAVDAFRHRLRTAGLIVATFSTDTELELEVFHALSQATGASSWTAPRQLPRGGALFPGRSAELATLSERLDAGVGVGGTVVMPP
jgi:hypothetical protein